LILAGNLAAWFYQTLGGINYDAAQTGFKHIVLRPRPVGDLAWVQASHRSLYGAIRSEWRIAEGKFHWTVTVPPNTTATVFVPTKFAATVTESGKPAARSRGVRLLRAEPEVAVFSVESGSYAFAAQR